MLPLFVSLRGRVSILLFFSSVLLFFLFPGGLGDFPQGCAASLCFLSFTVLSLFLAFSLGAWGAFSPQRYERSWRRKSADVFSAVARNKVTKQPGSFSAVASAAKQSHTLKSETASETNIRPRRDKEGSHCEERSRKQSRISDYSSDWEPEKMKGETASQTRIRVRRDTLRGKKDCFWF